MKKILILFFITVLFFPQTTYSLNATLPYYQKNISGTYLVGINKTEIHSKHFLYGMPKSVYNKNDILIRDCYALSNNAETKFADWVAYKLDKDTITGDAKQSRVWKTDPWLDENETLEPADYKDANKILNVDRGHQAPLASFKGTDCWQETNYLSNITPQNSKLNRGLWKSLESKVKRLAKTETVYVITGPLYSGDLLNIQPSLPNADESHLMPSGYWKIICIETKEILPLKVAGFVFTQTGCTNPKLTSYVYSINEIETMTDLDFLWELDDYIESEVESKIDNKWIIKVFK